MSLHRYNSPEEMHRMACFLIAKGKEVTSVEPHQFPYAIRAYPALRWTTERDYEDKIEAYMESYRKAHGVGENPREFSGDKIVSLTHQHWYCHCETTTIRPLQADKCFRCGDKYPDAYRGHPEAEALRAYLIKKHDKDKNASD